MMREMKESGVEWIGEIPVDWEICRFKNVVELYTGNSIKDEEKEQYEDSVDARPYIATKDIDITFGNVNYTNGLFIKLDDCSFKIAPRNSTLMCIEGGSAGRKKAKLSNDVAFVNKLCCFFSNKVDNTFLYYFLCSPNYEKEFTNNLSGLIGGVSVSVLKNISFLLPPPKHQHRIAAYLDDKCAKIDGIIEKEQQVIEMLKAYKQSIITEVVTKGLNPNVPMKDSGVEWIGEVPEGWKSNRLKFLFTLHRGYDLSTESFINGNISVYGSSGYMGKHNIATSLAPNVVIGRSGSTGKLHYISEDFWCHNTGIYISNAKGNDVKYIYYLLSKINLEELSTETAVPTLDRKKIQEYVFPFTTNIAEQQAIADYLDRKCNEIDSTIEKKQILFDKLNAYKKSLIYEVVTGKVEV